MILTSTACPLRPSEGVVGAREPAPLMKLPRPLDALLRMVKPLGTLRDAVILGGRTHLGVDPSWPLTASQHPARRHHLLRCDLGPRSRPRPRTTARRSLRHEWCAK